MTQTVNAIPLTRNSAAGNNLTSVASAVCAWLSWEREPRVATPAFLICSEGPRTCPTTAKRDWCAGLLGRMLLLLLRMFLPRNFQKIYRSWVTHLDYVFRYQNTTQNDRNSKRCRFFFRLLFCTIEINGHCQSYRT